MKVVFIKKRLKIYLIVMLSFCEFTFAPKGQT